MSGHMETKYFLHLFLACQPDEDMPEGHITAGMPSLPACHITITAAALLWD